MTVQWAQPWLEPLDVPEALDARAHQQMQTLQITAMNTKSF